MVDDATIRRGVSDADREVRAWRADAKPLSRQRLSRVAGAFTDVGEPAGSRQLRAADPATLGLFAAEHDAVLYELADDPDHGRLLGYPVDGGWAPLLVCVPGPAVAAADAVETFADAVAAAAGDVATP